MVSTSEIFAPNGSHYQVLQTAEQALVAGEVLTQTRPYRLGGGAVVAQMYLPLSQDQVWSKLTDYPRWVEYFPEIVQSRILESSGAAGMRRLYQVGRKHFLMLTAEVEVYLKVFEKRSQQLQFRLEKGTFSDFSADLTLQAFDQGTLLTYAVQAAASIPVPGFLIEQAMKHDLPGNMKTMRQAMCR
ncbi:MAG: cyclase [Leptolyngbyaceae cyanobacterium SM1_1_3]|nr:cyclase [Leptolyngbyaceae cyanobacterium SM1_1_3]NJN02052.1 cyclase [Leptolyngbyaceae cyanobacterium RM1_1_2]NJO09222.1 cyclase [Leptolyngbyaceae cyanobacterium SL_1_1]